MSAFINEKRITSLKVELDRGVFEQLVNLYFQELNALIFKLEEHILKKKTTESTQISHSIKGISSNMGATFIKDNAQELEQLCKESKFDDAFTKLNSLKSSVNNTIQEMQRMV